MPKAFDFDATDNENVDMGGMDMEEEQAAGAPQPVNAVDEAVQDIYGQEQDAEATADEFDQQMSAVEQRLAVAQCYRQLLDNPLFSSATNASMTVEREVIGFVRQRLAVLMGMQVEPTQAVEAKLPFSEQQVEVLKRVADKVIGAEANKAQAPTLNKVQPPAVEAPSPAVRQAPAVAAPAQVKPRQALPQRPVPVQPPAPRKPGQPPARPNNAPVRQPQARKPAATPIADSRIPEDYKNDPTIQVRNGRVFVQQRNVDGELLWSQDVKTGKTEPLLKDVTLPAKPAPGSGAVPLPMPSFEQSNMIADQQAGAMLTLAEKKTERLGVGNKFAAAVIQNIVPQTGEEGTGDRQ